ncbi:MAG: UvrD-helicase domain-containing protein [Bacteroidota bacterium]
MNLTQEQNNIIQSSGDIKINAVAGSGKTTTIIEYAKARPRSSRILYLAFNRSVKLEATKKFAEKGLTNVRVETAHSLAYRHIVRGGDYKVKASSYKTYEIAQLLGLSVTGEKHGPFMVANHINKFVAYFCNSDKSRIQELNYLDTINDRTAQAFVSQYYEYIERQTRQLLAKMDKGEIEITHDFYLKKFQLSNPQLTYDYILFDEGQDASAAMLDVFLNQEATKVIVGDTHQQIYGWRFAVNSLEKVSFKTYHLSASFRFSQHIADLAQGVLKWKEIIKTDAPFDIKGQGSAGDIQSKAIIARTNLGLLLKAIEVVTEEKEIGSIYFEGNINSYTYADDGASLYDVLSLSNNQRRHIRDPLIQQMKNLEELEEYIDKTEDVQLGLMVEIVKEYGNRIPGIIQSIKDKHVDNDDKAKAEMIFSTVHRCKGMEYDCVRLVADFISEEKLDKLQKESKEEELNVSKLNEEINLLYVAITRAKSRLDIPEGLLPTGFQSSPEIFVVQTPIEDEEFPDRRGSLVSIEGKPNTPQKTYSVEGVRTQHKDAYKPWTPALDEELTVMFCDGVHIKDMAQHFGRTLGAIRSRIKKLELMELYGWEGA